MKLLDHFHPPLNIRRHWHAFHNAWATYIASDLNTRLPAGYFAEPNVQFGIEIDVATMEEPGIRLSGKFEADSTVAEWRPPAPVMTIPLPLVTDVVEILVFESSQGPTLAGAIELISPSNKDCDSHREIFVSKCETYLQQSVGLVIIDVVTERRGNLHKELLTRVASTADAASAADLYTAAYRPVIRENQNKLDVWHESLAIGGPLPTMPLWLRGGLCLPAALGDTYDRTCREQRVN